MSNFRERRDRKIVKETGQKEYHDLKMQNTEHLSTIEELKKKLEGFEQLHLENVDNLNKLARLFDMGIIDREGEYTSNKIDDQDEMH